MTDFQISLMVNLVLSLDGDEQAQADLGDAYELITDYLIDNDIQPFAGAKA